MSSGPAPASGRAQANVVGVAILLGITVLALGALTAGVGTVVEQHAAGADQARVAAGLAEAVRPVRTTGVRRGTVPVAGGRLRTVPRTVRVLDGSGVVATVRADALVFEARDRGVTLLGGAVVRRYPTGATMYRPPPVTASRRAGVLVVGVAALRGNVSVAVSGGETLAVRTRVTHDRTALGNGSYRVAVETATPGVWERQFERLNATVRPPRDFDGDGTPSVVARFPGRRVAYLVVHRVRLEVGDG